MSVSIIDYTFPASSEVEIKNPWSFHLRNTGPDARIGFGVVNQAGNPGNIVLSYLGNDVSIAPLYPPYWRLATTNPIPNGEDLVVLPEDLSIRFEAPGTYNLLLWSMFLEGTTWYYDEEVEVSVTVTQTWPVTKTLEIFKNERLKPGIMPEQTKSKEIEIPINNDEGTPILLGGKLNLSLLFEEVAYGSVAMYWNNNRLFYRDFTVTNEGQTIQEVIDLGDMIEPLNVLKIVMGHNPFIIESTLWSVTAILGYSEEPPEDPGMTWEWPWEDWTMYDKALMGAFALGTIYIFSATRKQPPQQPIIIFDRGGKNSKD